MDDEVIIDESNLGDFLEQDLKSLEILKNCPEFNIDTTPEPLDIVSCEKDKGVVEDSEGIAMGSTPNLNEKVNLPNSKHEAVYKTCRCGNIIYKNHKSEFRCGACGCIIYGGSE